MTQPRCPEKDVLSDYCLGRLPGSEMEQVESHLTQCLSCQDTVTELDGACDALIEELRTPAVPDEFRQESKLGEAIAAACELPKPQVAKPAAKPSKSTAPDGATSGVQASAKPETAAATFDPYYEWLGIPPSDQPPHHYRLLGIALFEDNPKVIDNAAYRQIAHVRTFQIGQYQKVSQQILNELSAARGCLLDDKKRTAYDERLRKQQPAVPSSEASVDDAAWPDGKQPQSVQDMIACVVASGLHSAEELTTFLDSLPKTTRPKDAKATAMALINSGRLTRYQGKVLYQGHVDGLILGDLEILEPIGRGGSGNVYLAKHRRLDRTEAVKLLSPEQLNSPAAVARFEQEAKAAARLSHENIVTTHDAGQHHGVCYLAMEYVDGSDLARVVREQGPLPVEQAVDCVLQAARGLQVAHGAGIVHRDIKPHNLLLNRKGRVKILDLGLARFHDTGELKAAQEGLTQSGQIMGTLDYMSPEQAIDTHNADVRSDIYSLGCTLHFLLAGKVPFDGESVSQKLFAHRDDPIPSLQSLCEGVPTELDKVFQKMLAKSPDDRYQSMEEVIEALTGAAKRQAPVLTGARKSYGEDSKLDVFLSQIAGSIDMPRAARPVVIAAKKARHSRPAKKGERKPKQHAKPWTKGMNLPQIPPKALIGIGSGLAALLLLGVITMIFRTPMGEVRVEVSEEIADSVQVVLSDGGKQFQVSKEDDWTIELKEGTWDVSVKSDEYNVKAREKTVGIVNGKTAEVKVVLALAKEPEVLPRIKRGLVGELFGDSEFKRLVKTRVAPKINFDWGDKSPDSDLPVDNFSIRWTGWIKAPVTGRYRFHLSADDIGRMWLDGRMVIEDDREQRDVEIDLDQKPHSLKVEFVERSAWARAYLTWRLIGGSTEHVVPPEVLFQDRASADVATVDPKVLLTRPNLSAPLSRPGEPIDLLALTDPVADSIRGHWSFDGDVLVCEWGAPTVLRIPYSPPAEYEVTMRVQGTSGHEALFLGTPAGGKHFGVTIGRGADGRGIAGVDAIDGMRFNDRENETREIGTLTRSDRPVELKYTIRESRLTLTCDGRTIIDWNADYRRCSTWETWTVPSEGNMTLGSLGTGFLISKLECTPLTNEPQKFRDFDSSERNSANGLHMELYRGTDFDQRVGERRVVPRLDFSWRKGSPGYGLPSDGFSARWTGWLKAPRAGKYRLLFAVNGGLRVCLDEKPIIERWKDESTTDISDVELTNKPHKIRIEYFDSSSDAVVSFRWAQSGVFQEQVVSSESLFIDSVTAATSQVPAPAAITGSAKPLCIPIQGMDGLKEVRPSNPVEAWKLDGVFARINGKGAIDFPTVRFASFALEWRMRLDAVGGFVMIAAGGHRFATEAHFLWEPDPESKSTGSYNCRLCKWDGKCWSWNGHTFVQPYETLSCKLIVHEGKSALYLNDKLTLRGSYVSSDPSLRIRSDESPLATIFDMSIRNLRSEELKELGGTRIETTTPPPARSPFDLDQAKQHQQAWAEHLGVPVEFTNSIGMKFRLIPPGEFMMGSPEDEEDRNVNEGPLHRVRLANPYYMGACEVTHSDYQRVLGDNAVNSANDIRPVTAVSWHDAMEFCRRLSLLDNREYRLPTEAQWEYACRAGTTTPFHFGTALNGKQANCRGDLPYGASTKGPNLQKAASVGQYPANGFGLYDVHGNAWEWCRDWYDIAYYKSSAPTDPVGPASGSSRITRGGGWGSGASICRSATRGNSAPETRNFDLGFRVALVLAADGNLKVENIDELRKSIEESGAADRFSMEVLRKSIEQAKRAVPKEESLADLRSRFRQMTAGKESFARLAWAGRSLQSVGKISERNSRYAMLDEARRVAAEAGEMAMAMHAIELLADEFDIDAEAMKVETLNTAARKVRSSLRAAEVLDATVGFAKEATSASTVLDLMEVLDLLGQSMSKCNDADLKLRIATQQRRVKLIGELLQGSLRGAKELEQNPADAFANWQRGIYLAIVPQDWEKALPYLAKCNQPHIADAADRVLKNPEDTAALVAFGDAWWKHLELAKDDEDAAAPIREAARKWYLLALSKTTGDELKRIEERICEPLPQSKATSPFALSLNGLAGLSVVQPTKADGAIVAANGFATINGKASLVYPTIPTANYVHELELDLTGPDGKLVIKYGHHEGSEIVFFWNSDKKKFYYEQHHYQGGGIWWSGHIEAESGERLRLTICSRPGWQRLLRDDKEVKAANTPEEDLRFQLTTDKAKVRIYRCEFRPWTCLDEKHTKEKQPVQFVATGPGEQVAEWHDRNHDLEVKPNLTNPGSFVVASTATAMEWIEPGSFVRSYGKDKPTTTVAVSRGYWIGRYEVTQEEWLTLAGTNPSRVTGSPYLPVDGVSYQDVGQFCAMLNAREQKLRRLLAGYVYRLPTEAEWEYACRAGGTGDFSVDTDGFWYDKLSDQHPHEVGTGKPNAWGLYDMHGNVCEWVLDGWKEWSDAPPSRLVDPFNLPKAEGGFFVSRGGSWWRNQDSASSGWRRYHESIAAASRGFRLVLAPMPRAGAPPK